MSSQLATRWIILGCLFVLISILLQGINQVIYKYYSFTVIQLITTKWIIQLMIASLWWVICKPSSTYIYKPEHLREEIETNTPSTEYWYGNKSTYRNIWIRAIIFSIQVPLFLYGTLTLPLGDFISIHFLSSILVAMTAHFVWKETTPKMSILLLSILLISTGIVIISQPNFMYPIYDSDTAANPEDDVAVIESLPVGGLICTIMSAFAWAYQILCARSRPSVHPLQVMIPSYICIILISTTLMLFINWISPSDIIGGLDLHNNGFLTDNGYQGLFVIFGCAVIDVVSMVLFIVGFQFGDLRVMGWLELIQIGFGYIYQMWIFGDIPNLYEIIGGCIISFGGSIVLMNFIWDLYKMNKSDHIKLISYEYDIDDYISSSDPSDSSNQESSDDTDDDGMVIFDKYNQYELLLIILALIHKSELSLYFIIPIGIPIGIHLL